MPPVLKPWAPPRLQHRPRRAARRLATSQAPGNPGCQGLTGAQTIPAPSPRRHVPSRHSRHWCAVSLPPDHERLRRAARDGGQGRANSCPPRSDPGLLTFSQAGQDAGALSTSLVCNCKPRQVNVRSRAQASAGTGTAGGQGRRPPGPGASCVPTPARLAWEPWNLRGRQQEEVTQVKTRSSLRTPTVASQPPESHTCLSGGTVTWPGQGRCMGAPCGVLLVALRRGRLTTQWLAARPRPRGSVLNSI